MRVLRYITTGIFTGCAGLILFFNSGINPTTDRFDVKPRFSSDSEQPEDASSAKGRAEYFKTLLMDPETGEVPSGIREMELDHAETLPTKAEMAKRRPDQIQNNLIWFEAGPNDVGGRTRALGIDRRNSNIILAGGVSGGIWRSTDGGDSWTKRTPRDGNLSITSLAQDPESPDKWYASMGEVAGNSASDRGSRARYYGSGIYRSTDNGSTWEFVQKATAQFPTAWNSDFHYTSKIGVAPAGGKVYLAANAVGIMASGDGGTTFEPVLGNTSNDHFWSDFDFSAEGHMAIGLSSGTNETTEIPSGVYVKRSGDATFQQVVIPDYPEEPGRTLVAFSPSNGNVFYAMVYAGSLSEEQDDVRFYKLTFENNAWAVSDRSANMPLFGGLAGYVATQGEYNMVLEVKPDDENFVVIGFTNLFRSRDGFQTRPSNNAAGKTETWIGGYTNSRDSYALYSNHHPDQHALCFDPADPNRLWSGHDGGLSVSANISVSGSNVGWTSKNNGYNVTQFYTVGIDQQNGSPYLAGGTQDNGTPYFSFEDGNTSESSDISSGDGSYLHYGTRFLYVSTQNGNVSQYDIELEDWRNTNAYPEGVTGQLFIHPFAISPVSDAIMVYPAGRDIWYNLQMDATDNPDFWQLATPTTAQIPSTHGITTLAFSSDGTVVYLAASRQNTKPVLVAFNLDTKQITGGEIPGVGSNWYPHGIATHPSNKEEFLLTFSNYNIEGVFHTTNGGTSYTVVEGNLAGTASEPGPSIRKPLIVTVQGGATEYYLGTSTGLYSTRQLDGSNTVWMRESNDVIGTSIVEDLDYRASDGKIAAATHGRGLFVGNINVASSSENRENPSAFQLHGNYPNPFNPATTVSFSLAAPSVTTITVYSAAGQKVADVFSGMLGSGQHAVQINAQRWSSGVYFYQVSAGGTVRNGKMTLLK